jgi:4-hydroxy-tetrahydrodipicolinate reductase
MVTTIYLQGARGRMVQTIASLVQDDFNFALRDDLVACDVAVDFSVPAALPALLNACIKAQKPLVVGTTGYGDSENQLLQKASEHIPVFYTPNFSIGIALLQEMVRELAEKIEPQTSIEIVEAHRQHKKDCPSGTALLLAEATGRASVPIHSIRAGDIIGDHTVIFGFKGERLELKHQVHTRDVFARGALRAVQFLKSQPPGYYTMKDLLYASC